MPITHEPWSTVDLRARRLTWPLVVYLLIRIVAANLVGALPSAELRAAAVQIVEVGMYATIGVMIYLARDDLVAFHMDGLSLAIFLLFGTLLRTSTRRNLSYVDIAAYVILYLISVALLVALWHHRGKRQSGRLRLMNWLLVGLIAGLGLLLLELAPRMVQNYLAERLQLPQIPGLSLLPAWIVDAMGHSAILEEPVLRGFLWGHLRERGLGERRIWLVQTVAFWLAHIRYVGQPYTFLIAVPVAGFVLGWLAWRSRSLAPSYIAHSLYNSIVLLA